MNRVIFALTLRQFFGQRRSLLLILLALVPIGVALIYRLGDAIDQHEWTTEVLLDGNVIAVILPLACLILGTAALGSEIEDGTAVFILAKPIQRFEIILAKYAAAVLIVALFVVPGAAIASLIALEGVAMENIPVAFAVATTLGIIAYCALFVFLSVASSRSLIFGLAYVFIWEGLVTELFTGTRWISIRHYCLAVADLLSTVDPDDFEAELAGVPALILLGAVTAIAIALATRRLQRLELTETD